jgi:hypothetical protein
VTGRPDGRGGTRPTAQALLRSGTRSVAARRASSTTRSGSIVSANLPVYTNHTDMRERALSDQSQSRPALRRDAPKARRLGKETGRTTGAREASSGTRRPGQRAARAARPHCSRPPGGCVTLPLADRARPARQGSTALGCGAQLTRTLFLLGLNHGQRLRARATSQRGGARARTRTCRRFGLVRRLDGCAATGPHVSKPGQRAPSPAFAASPIATEDEATTLSRRTGGSATSTASPCSISHSASC